MAGEMRDCVACKEQFVIEPEDLTFYGKFEVSLPKRCPQCRSRRRMAFRNERAFYKRKCDRCGREVVSMYSPNKPYVVYCYECWFADDWDALSYGREYDPARPFMEQFAELWKVVPKIALVYVRSVNSEYVNISADNKDCYMLVESSNNEGCIHCYWIQQCRDLVDVSFSHQTELSYECDDCFNCYRLQYGKGCHDCRESYFLFDCVGCTNCVGCANLRGKQYYIFNEPQSKEGYETFLARTRLDTHDGVEMMRKKFDEFLRAQPHKFAEILKAPNCTGNYVKNAKNCRQVFHCYDAEDSKYGIHVWRDAKDCMDVDTAGRGANMIYNSINSGLDVANYVACAQCWTCSFMAYSCYCFNCNNCFGCAGLRKKDYCILNRQYKKQEYEAFREAIVAEMKTKGDYGEFFPATLSTFGYNETAAEEQFPLAKSEALARGYTWEDHPRGTYGKGTIAWDKVPDHYDGFDPTHHVFTCANCKRNYLIIPNELTFYKKLSVPVPRLCPECRHTRRFKARGPNHLWHRACMCKQSHAPHADAKCPNEFETSYAPDRPEIVYCEQCYNAEVV
ncbi:MAG: hypothetical protein ABSC29_04115 [Minisyncoccia bacterium]|jgi:hypothetical protein